MRAGRRWRAGWRVLATEWANSVGGGAAREPAHGRGGVGAAAAPRAGGAGGGRGGGGALGDGLGADWMVGGCVLPLPLLSPLARRSLPPVIGTGAVMGAAGRRLEFASRIPARALRPLRRSNKTQVISRRRGCLSKKDDPPPMRILCCRPWPNFGQEMRSLQHALLRRRMPEKTLGRGRARE